MPTPYDIVAEATKVAGSWTRIPSIIEEAGFAATREGIAAYLASEGIAVTVADEAAGAELFNIWAWIIFLGISSVVIVLYALEQIFLGLAGALPGVWGIRDHARAFVHWVFGPLDLLLNELNAFATDLAYKTVYAWIHWLDWILPHTHTIQALRAAGTGTPPTGNVAVQIADLQAQVSSQQNEIAGIESVLQFPPQPAVSPPSTFPAQVRTIQAEILTINQRLSSLEADVGSIAQSLLAIGPLVNQLSLELHGIRAAVATLPEIETGILRQLGVVQATQAAQGAQLQTHSNTLHDLSPIMLLVSAGAAGLENLRKLEDNICQCPRFADVPNELGAALAAWEALVNGV